MNVSSHRISIPTLLEVGTNTIQEIGKILKKKKFMNITVFFSDGIYDIVGKQVLMSLKENNIKVLDSDIIEDINVNLIMRYAFKIPHQTEIILGVGGGRAIDAAKYMAFLRKIPFVSVPTSTSNDGFSSSSSSLLIDGKRTTVHAKMPYGIIIDTDIIKGAPDQFLYSGIGDLVSNITAIRDWRYEEEEGYTIINDFAAMISDKAVNSFIHTDFSTIKDQVFLNELINSLTLNGIAMEIAGTSSPSSGSEHLISHALDQIKLNELHGIQVGIATYIMSYVQQNRHYEIVQILKDTGFFDYVIQLNIKKEFFIKATRLAPSIKPNRYTYLHNQFYQDKAINFIMNDSLLNHILT